MAAKKTHGLTKTKIYKIWSLMKTRCLYERDKCYHHNGGRGISVCPEWIKDVKAFANWASANGYREGLSLDRIDNNGNYTPDNCRWADSYQQGRNKRNNVIIDCDGERKILAEWARETGTAASTIKFRLDQGVCGPDLFAKCRVYR